MNCFPDKGVEVWSFCAVWLLFLLLSVFYVPLKFYWQIHQKKLTSTVLFLCKVKDQKVELDV